MSENHSFFFLKKIKYRITYCHGIYHYSTTLYVTNRQAHWCNSMSGGRVNRLLVTFLGSQLDKPWLSLVAPARVHVNIAVIINVIVLYILVSTYLLEIKLLLQRNYIYMYHKISNRSHTLAGNKIVDHSDVVGALPVGAAPTTSSFSTHHWASMDWAKTTARWNEKHLSFEIWCPVVLEIWWYVILHWIFMEPHSVLISGIS